MGYLSPCTGQIYPSGIDVRVDSGGDAHADAFEHPFTHTLQLLEYWLCWGSTYTQVWQDRQSFGIFNCKTTAGKIQPWLLADLGA